MSPQAEEIWAILKENSRQLEKLEIFQKETTEQMRKTDEKLNRIANMVDGIGKNQGFVAEEFLSNSLVEHTYLGAIHFDDITENEFQGFVAEEFFFNSLIEHTYLGAIHFDDITKNAFKHRGNTQEEFDILMTNDSAIGIIEVKYKAHEKDLDTLERKMRNFKTLYPIYAHYKLYGAIAAFHIYEDAKKAALERGFFVLQRKGKIVTTESAENLLVL